MTRASPSPLRLALGPAASPAGHGLPGERRLNIKKTNPPATNSGPRLGFLTALALLSRRPCCPSVRPSPSIGTGSGLQGEAGTCLRLAGSWGGSSSAPGSERRVEKPPLCIYGRERGALFLVPPRALKAGEGEGWGYRKAARRVSAGAKQRWGCRVAGATRSLPPVGAANYTPPGPPPMGRLGHKKRKSIWLLSSGKRKPGAPPKRPRGESQRLRRAPVVMPARWGHPVERGHPLEKGWGRAPGGGLLLFQPPPFHLPALGFPPQPAAAVPDLGTVPAGSPAAGTPPWLPGRPG